MSTLTAEDVQRAVGDWRAKHPNLSIAFSESRNPDRGSSDDYVVAYEASFKSSDLKQLQLEVFSTEDNFVGVGIETRQRLATRLGLRQGRPGYATGHEPGPMSLDQLYALLDAAADGRISLLPQTSLLGLGKTTAVLAAKGGSPLPRFDTSRHWRWLRVSSKDGRQTGGNPLLYGRW